MRTVCFYTDSIGFGGAEKAMLALIGDLERRHWNPLLLHNAPEESPLVAAARRAEIPCETVAPLPEGLRGSVRVPSLVRRLRRIAPDVFHAHLTWTIACRNALAAARVARVPAVVATHQLYLDFPVTRGRRIQQRAIGSGIAHIAVSDYVRRRLEATFPWLGGRVRVIPNCVDAEAFAVPRDAALAARLRNGHGDMVALVPARLEPQKGHAYLIAAARSLPGVRFLLAGEGSLRNELVAAAAAAGVGDRFAFLGYRDDVPALMACSDLVVLPSVEEGLPLVVLEAMAAGLPIVATRAGGTAEAIEDGVTGVLVAPGDARALAAAISQVLSDPSRATVLAEAGRQRARTVFRPQAMVAATGDLYDELLEGHPD